MNVPFSSTVWLFSCRVMYAVVTSAAAILTAVQSVWLNLRIFLCGFLVLDVIKLKVPITMLWSDMPGYTETSMTVSGLLVSIRSNIFPDIGLVVILQCWLTPISLIVSRNLVQWFRSLVEFVCSVKMISLSQSMQVRFMSPPIMCTCIYSMGPYRILQL